jgi:hypothetical protein
MADKNFKVKKNLQVTDLAVAGPVTVDSSGVLASSSALPVNLGGTGQTSASAALSALVPTQTNNANKLLGTDGTSVSWVSPGIAYQTSAPDNPVTGQLWVDSDETGDSLDPYIIRRKTITATAGQTVFTTDVIFTDGYEQIYYNGVLLVRTTDYTTSGGTNTVTLLQGASAGDTVEIISSTPINLVNTVTTNSSNTITASTASSIPLKIVGAASQSADLFEVLNSSNAELFAIRSSGRVKSEIISTESDSLNLRLHANVNNASSGVSVILWGKDVGTWGGDVHYLADSRGASGAHRFWNWDGTNFLQRMSIDKTGLVDMGVLKSTRFDANTTLTDTTLRTYSANTWYNLGTFPTTSSETFFCQFVIQMTDVNYHTYIGCFIMPATYWKASGTLWTQTFVAEQHNGNNATVTVRLTTGAGTRGIDFQTDQSITVTTGGFVKLKMKRMFQHD